VRESGKVAPTDRETAGIREALLNIGVQVLAADERQGALPSHLRFNSLHIARVCEDYAVASHFQGVTLAQLCCASNVSERRVRDAYYDCYGMSPTAYLRVAALHGVREALLAGPLPRDAVSRVACDFGFWHLSRFAGQYRALFGEAPSTTVARRPNFVAS
jgi:AraC family ethanolamine operon transcriptional activator